MVDWKCLPSLRWQPLPSFATCTKLYHVPTAKAPLDRTQNTRGSKSSKRSKAKHFLHGSISSREVSAFCLSGYSKGTLSQMKSAWNLYLNVTAAASVAPLPLSRLSLCSFVCAMTKADYAYNSVLRYLTHVKNKASISGYKSAPTTDFWVTLALRASGKLLGKGTVLRAHTLTIEQVPSILEKLNEAHATMFLLGTVALLRISELQRVQVQDIVFTSTGIHLRIPRSKTDQCASGRVVPLVCLSSSFSSSKRCTSNLCVPHALKHWLDSSPDLSASSNLFTKEQSNSFPMSLSDALFDLLGNRPRCTTHCMRRSGALIAFRRGMPLEEIALLGRWSGTQTLVDNYLRDATDELSQISKQVFKVWRT
ncbi:hypothetical protein FOL47_011140 [Perkinsus chesapeaki]|uniref:Tyr recombinase domain-containing protein n=1 Tax=Perkinsus chesapeaki TaxID=330153 RepID=A0A7J6KZL7_PERCH|nr:hypothetical protein FOL47_011140 [Perkinsus chesapeaki]